MQRTAMELRDALISRLAQSATLSLTDEELARVTRREVRAALFIDAAFGARICPAASPSAPPPSTPPPSTPPSAPISPPPLQPLSPPPHAAVLVRVQLFDSFGDGWGGLQFVVSQFGGAAEHSFTLSPGLGSTTASLSLPLGCHRLQMVYQSGETPTNTSMGDAAEASWRLLDCPTGASSFVHLAHEVAEACVTMEESAAENRCRLLEPPMLPPPPPSPDTPPREHPLPPSLPLPSPLPSATPGTPPSPPSSPALPIPSVYEAPLPLTPAAPISPGPQEPPPPHVPEPSPPLSPTMLLTPSLQTAPCKPFMPSAPVPPSPSLPLSPVNPLQLGVSSPLPPHLPPAKPARPPFAPTEQSTNGDDTNGGLDADDTTGGLDADYTIGGLDSNTFMARLLIGVIVSAAAVFFCVTWFDARRKGRRAHAYAQRMAEHNAPINQSFVCGNSQTTAAQWLEHGDRNAQPRRQSDAQLERYRQQMISPEEGPQPDSQRIVGRIASETAQDEPRRENPARPISPGVKSRFKQRFVVRSFNVDSAGTSEEHAGLPTTTPLFGWNRMMLSGPPSLSSEAATDDRRNEPQEFHVDANRFALPPLAVLATGDARVATIESLRQCFMLHSVVHAVSAAMLKNVLLEAAELRKLKPHPGLLRLCAVVTDQPWGEVGLLSELTTGSLATLLDTSPIHLTWANGLLALATDVAEGLAHLHGLGL